MPGGWCGTGWSWRAAGRASRRRAPRSPVVAVVVIVALLAAVTALRWNLDRAGEAVALLYVVPIALAGVRFGRRGGLAVAGFGVAAFAGLELVRARGDVDLTGWVAPLLAMALMGGLVGHLSEASTRSEAALQVQARHLEELRHTRSAATRAGDSMVQQLAAARWMLEAGNGEGALAALEATVAMGISEFSSSLPPLSPTRLAPGGLLDPT